MIYKSKHFALPELIPKSLFKSKGYSAWRYLDAYALHDLDIIRDEVKRKTGQGLIINDWYWNGQYNESGLRTPDCHYYNPLSAHTFGKAFDIKIASWLKGDYTYDADWLRSLIYQMKADGKLKYLTEVETETETWVHLGFRNSKPNHNNLFVFKP